MAVFEKAPTIGGTTAVSGGIVWIPAHNRAAGGELSVADALKYLEAQSLGVMDHELVETFVRTGPAMLDYVEAHSALRFEVAEGFPDYKPELPGGQPGGGRSLNAKPFDLATRGRMGRRASRHSPSTSATSVSTPRRGPGIHAAVDDMDGDYCVAGAALIAGLLKGLLDLGVAPVTEARAVELIGSASGITGVRIALGGKEIRVRAAQGGDPGHRRVRMGSAPGRGLPARAVARPGVTAEQHR